MCQDCRATQLFAEKSGLPGIVTSTQKTLSVGHPARTRYCESFNPQYLTKVNPWLSICAAGCGNAAAISGSM